MIDRVTHAIAGHVHVHQGVCAIPACSRPRLASAFKRVAGLQNCHPGTLPVLPFWRQGVQCVRPILPIGFVQVPKALTTKSSDLRRRSPSSSLAVLWIIHPVPASTPSAMRMSPDAIGDLADVAAHPGRDPSQPQRLEVYEQASGKRDPLESLSTSTPGAGFCGRLRQRAVVGLASPGPWPALLRARRRRQPSRPVNAGAAGQLISERIVNLLSRASRGSKRNGLAKRNLRLEPYTTRAISDGHGIASNWRETASISR